MSRNYLPCSGAERGKLLALIRRQVLNCGCSNSRTVARRCPRLNTLSRLSLRKSGDGSCPVRRGRPIVFLRRAPRRG
jgi:hypothetical protein